VSPEEVLLKLKAVADLRGFKEFADKNKDLESSLAGTRSAADKAGAGMKGAGAAAASAGDGAERGGKGFGILKAAMLGAGVAGGIALAGLATAAISSAADVAESQNKVNVVFGDSAKAIDDLAATAATKLGQTKGEVLDAAGGIGNLLTAMGQSKESAADMSVGLINLAADLGSFNNASSTDVLAAMQAAMAGETDGMKKYGVAINEATLKQAAMDAGLGSNVQALSIAEKQQLAYNIMLSQTKSAQGDFANTSTGMANSMKIINATVSDAVAELGGRLLPIVAPLVAAIGGSLPGALDTAIGFFDRLTGKGSLIANTLTTVSGYVSTFMAGFNSNPDASFIDKLVSGFSALGLNMQPAIDAALLFKQKIDELVAAASPWIAKIDETVGLGNILAGVILAVVVPAFLSWAAGAVTAAAGTITALAPVMVPILLIGAGIAILKKAWDTNFGGIQEKTAEVFAAVGVWINKAKAWFDELVGKFKSGNWGGIASQIMGALAGGISSAGRLVIDGFHRVVNLASAALAKVNWSAVGGTLMELLGKGVLGAVGLIGAAFLVVGKAAFDIIIHTDWIKLAKDVLTLLARGVVAALSIIGGAFGKLAQAAGDVLKKTNWGEVARTVLTTLAGAFSSLQSEMGKAGSAVIEGLKKGMTDGFVGLVSWVQAKMSDIISGVLATFGISSPSKVFATIGTALMLGLALGITFGGASAEAAMTSAIAKVNTSAKDELAKMNQDLVDFYGKAFGPGGSWEKIVKMWTSTVDNDRDTMALGHLDPRNLPKPPDWRILAGDPEAAKKAWDKFWADAAAMEDKRNKMTVGERLPNDPDGKRNYTPGSLTELEHHYTGEQWQENIARMHDIEKNRHAAIMAMIAAEQSGSEALAKARDEAQAKYLASLEAARQAVQAAQQAAEQRESLVSAAVLEHIEQQAKAWETAHNERLAGLEREKTAEDNRHEAAMAGFAAERKVHTDYLDRVEAGVKRLTDEGKALSVQLGRLKIDLNLDAEKTKLDGLKDKLSEFQSVLGKLDAFDPADAKGAAAKAAKAAREKIMLTTVEQKKALAAVQGGLTGDDARTAALLMQGHALSATKVRDLMGRIAEKMKGQVDSQQGVIDAKQAELDALQKQIDLNKQLADEAGLFLESERTRVQVILDGIASREAAENERNSAELARIASLVSAENSAYERQKQAIEDMKQREADRHTDRMRQIGEEYAMQLALLDHTPEEVAAMVAAAAAEAKRIGEEAAAKFAAVKAAAEATQPPLAAGADEAVRLSLGLGLAAKSMEDLKLSAETFVVTLSSGWVNIRKDAAAYFDLITKANEPERERPMERMASGKQWRQRADGSWYDTGMYRAMGNRGGPPGSGEGALRRRPGDPGAGNLGPGGIVGGGAGGLPPGSIQPATLNMTAHIESPVYLDTEIIGTAMQRTIVKRGLNITLAPNGG
jgi:hypothetical protein